MMKLPLSFSLFLLTLATAASIKPSVADMTDTSITHVKSIGSGPRGKGAVFFLDAPKDEYIKVLAEGGYPGLEVSYGCAAAKVFTGQCGFQETRGKCACFPPDDRACTYVKDCRGLAIQGCGVPNAIVDDEGRTACRCPAKCADARAGFARGPRPPHSC
ncbi:hypothetical protein IWX50DRAFT_614575 [Phyllosticta citricarpa]